MSVHSAHSIQDQITVWHNRLAHVNRNKITQMIREKQLPDISASNTDACTDCSLGKQARDSFKGHIDKATNHGDVIHSDVVGPLPFSVSGARYFVTFIDEVTRFVTAVPIKRKSQVLECFKEFKVMFERQFNCTIKSIHSDNVGEYTTTLLQSGLRKQLWAEALANAVAVRNRILRDDGMSPLESLTGNKQSLDRFKPFGCSALAQTRK